jgi:hypothetical protein
MGQSDPYAILVHVEPASDRSATMASALSASRGVVVTTTKVKQPAA